MKADTQRLYADVEFLTKLRPARSYQNIASLTEAAVYIEREFHNAGAQTARQTWIAWDHEYANIIASYNIDKSERIVIGAHYDVAGDQPGADDNASGVAGLLELARLVFFYRPKLDFRIDFVAYCLEEPPFFATEEMGSYVHARAMHMEKVKVIGMIGLEMIGFFSDEPNSQQYPAPELARIYPSTANFIVVVGVQDYREFNNKVHQLMSRDSAIDVQVISFPSGEALAGLSDHRNYWKFRYPALMINDTSFIRNPHYHQRSDTIDTLDFAKMSAVVDCLFNMLKSF